MRSGGAGWMLDGRRTMRKLLRKLKGLPALAAARALALPAVSARLSRRSEASRADFQNRRPRLSPPHEDIVRALETSGVHVTSLDALGFAGSQAMLQSCQTLAAKYRRMRLDGGLDDNDGFQADASDLLAHRSIFDWGVNETLLDIAEAYLGQPAAYDGLNLFYTKADGRQVAARKWHRDMEDRRVLKIAVYVNDVEDDGGPFQILNRPAPESETAAAYPIFTEEQLARRIGRPLDGAAVTTCTGPAGTVVFAETALRYHRGKPATARDRCAVFYNYFARPPLRPFLCERSTLSRRQLLDLAETFNARQRACVDWRRSTPPMLRWIPSAPV
jgi:hypothetical protein